MTLVPYQALGNAWGIRAGPAYGNDGKITISFDGIPASIAAVISGGEVPHHMYSGPRLPQDADEKIPFLVSVAGNFVGDLKGEQREAHPPVECCCAHHVHIESARQLPIRRADPEPDMVALGGAACHFPFESQVLLLVKHEQWADRSAGDSCGAAARRG